MLVSKQQIYLGKLQDTNINATMDIKKRALDGSLLGDLFSCLHGDLITNIKWTNKEAVKF